MIVIYRKAVPADAERIQCFCDFWLTGGGMAAGIPGAGKDFFVPLGRHKDYIRKYTVVLAELEGELVGWAVKTQKGVLVHLLVAATYRRMGIGSQLVALCKPSAVRSKFDQSSGDPTPWYEKLGFVDNGGPKIGKNKNIILLIKEYKP